MPLLLTPVRRDRPALHARPLPRRRHLRRALLLGDVFALAAGFCGAALAGAARSASGTAAIGALALTIAGGLTAAAVYGLYSRDEQRADHSTADDLAGAIHVTLIVTWIVTLALWASGAGLSVPSMVVQFVTSLLLLLLFRATLRSLYRRRSGHFQNTVIVGAGAVGQLLAGKLMNRPVHGLRLVGFVDDDAPQVNEALSHVPLLGCVEQLPEVIGRYDVERVIVAFSRQSHQRTLMLVRALKDVEIQVDVVPRLFDFFGPNADIHVIDGLPLIGHPRGGASRAETAAKRALDLTLSVAGTIVLAPVFALLAALVTLDSRGPTIYRAERVGRDGRIFTQLKFRTMKAEYCHGSAYGGEHAAAAFERLLAENAGLREQYERTHKLDPDPRVTRIGRLLRASSLDELPQLFNVIRGDLSLVGPRPVTAAELERYGEDVPQLLSVRPGLTGYWQINGRSALRYDERVRLDLAYVSSWSLKLDLQILVKTTTLLTARAGAV